ncbi:hypothetical protein DLJ53_11855 [Acuticoccus sediminis]|uniref:TRAP-type C4-dicarboxylate transport system, substrate-binding protein n=1 Tax=Acuticoccus sediminis TaxID=2184697 RepID=A0A8B2NQ96_9HYPH|nr:TRAP transporter substrate-binding protein [Acuticoccus sediminis]RAI02065.1 hypothetical protein DLJ53_11855 [Acuticoccus sediminis]
MKLQSIATACLGLAAGALLFGTSAQAQDVRLRFAAPVPERHWILQNDLFPWAKKLEAESGGRLAIDIQPVGVFGTPDKYLELVESGVIDAAWFVPGYAPGQYPLTTAVELPFLFDTAAHASTTFWTLYEDGLLGDEYADVKPLALWMNVPYIIMTKNHPVKELSDLDGLKLRASGRMVGSVLEAIGATGVGMPASEMAEAIRLGVLNGTAFSHEAVEPFGIADQITDFNEIPVGSITHIVIMNKDKYESLPDDLKALIDENSGLVLSEQLGRSYDTADAHAREKYAGNDQYTTNEPSEALMSDLETAVAPVVESWKEEARAAGGDPDAILARIKELNGE